MTPGQAEHLVTPIVLRQNPAKSADSKKDSTMSGTVEEFPPTEESPYAPKYLEGLSPRCQFSDHRFPKPPVDRKCNDYTFFFCSKVSRTINLFLPTETVSTAPSFIQ